MSLFDPFSPTTRLRCACGAHSSQAEHDAQPLSALEQGVQAGSFDAMNRRALESAVMRAVFPDDAERRRFIRAVGQRTAQAAVASIPKANRERMVNNPQTAATNLGRIIRRA